MLTNNNNKNLHNFKIHNNTKTNTTNNNSKPKPIISKQNHLLSNSTRLTSIKLKRINNQNKNMLVNNNNIININSRL